MKKLLVLLSTWNGAKYLPAQLDSLFALDWDGHLSILIRDDGSTDGTIGIIRERNDARIRLLEGDNVGPRASFFELLRLAQQDDADYVALCDQDDVWHIEKIRRATTMIETCSPTLYASSLRLVDEHLLPVGTFNHPGNRSFTSTLMTNFVTGCTCVMNRAFISKMLFPTEIDKTIMHDWWLASVATLGYRIVYDRKSFIDYRQHASNHVGIQTGILATYAKLRRIMRDAPHVTRFDHAKQFLQTAGSLFGDEQRAIMTQFLAGETTWTKRLLFVLRYRADIEIQTALRFVMFK